MEEKTVKVNCSFCGKEIECPEDMLNAEKHACWECFEKLQDTLPHEEIHKIHVDIPMEKMDEMMEEMLTKRALEHLFPYFWKEAKEELKDMPRKEAVKQAFAAGAQGMFQMITEMERQTEKEESEQKKEDGSAR